MDVTKTDVELKDMYEGQSSILVMIVGESGRGKSTSMRNLDPEETYLINCASKLPPFPAGSKYRKGKNMANVKEAQSIRRLMQDISRDVKFKNIIIDDGQNIMTNEFVQKALEKGYDKFSLMAKNMYDVLTQASELRGGLKVYFLCHEEETYTGKRKMKTVGKMLDEKITPEGLSTIVLYAELINREEKGNLYVFKTQSDGQTNAKSPMGMFPEVIPNDLKIVSDRIDEYYSDITLNESKISFELDKGR